MSDGDLGVRRNKNRGYMKLRVWQDAVAFYVEVCPVFRGVSFELSRVASQAIASSDSVHRNIAEGYCRRSILEYLNFLNIALGSLGESVSGLHAYRQAKQVSDEEFEKLDALAYRLENGLLKLVESLERKRDAGDWIETPRNHPHRQNNPPPKAHNNTTTTPPPPQHHHHHHHHNSITP